MSLLEWAAKSRHESPNEPVIAAEQLACPGAAAAGVNPPTQASRAAHATHAVRFVFAQLMATSIGNACLQFFQRSRTAGPDTRPPPARERKTGVGFGRVVTLDQAGEVSMRP